MISHSVVEKWAKKSENHKIWADFDPLPANLFWESPKILKPVLDTPFQGLLLGQFGPSLTLRGEKISPPNFFLGGGVHHGYISRHHDLLPLVKI